MEGVGLDQEEREDGPVCGGQTGRQRKEGIIDILLVDSNWN